MMRVIVCGSRTWTDANAIYARLAALPRPVTVVHGDCSGGADAIVDEWCAHHYCGDCGITTEPHPAKWDAHGKRAGPIRNSEMAAKGADLCIAFRANGRSPGTDDMVKKCRAAGIPVEIVTP